MLHSHVAATELLSSLYICQLCVVITSFAVNIAQCQRMTVAPGVLGLFRGEGKRSGGRRRDSAPASEAQERPQSSPSMHPGCSLAHTCSGVTCSEAAGRWQPSRALCADSCMRQRCQAVPR